MRFENYVPKRKAQTYKHNSIQTRTQVSGISNHSFTCDASYMLFGNSVRDIVFDWYYWTGYHYSRAALCVRKDVEFD